MSRRRLGFYFWVNYSFKCTFIEVMKAAQSTRTERFKMSQIRNNNKQFGLCVTIVSLILFTVIFRDLIFLHRSWFKKVNMELSQLIWWVLCLFCCVDVNIISVSADWLNIAQIFNWVHYSFKDSNTFTLKLNEIVHFERLIKINAPIALCMHVIGGSDPRDIHECK